MSADEYLNRILARESVDTGPFSPVRAVQAQIQPALREWAGNYLASVSPSVSFAKGTANHSGTDIDLFISLAQQTPNTLKEIYETLCKAITAKGYTIKRQNVSINVKIGGYSVDLIPAKRQDSYSDDHSLYRRKADTWTKTNVARHINYVRQGGRISESRIVKLWRNQKGFDFPSFYLELTVISALYGQYGTLSGIAGMGDIDAIRRLRRRRYTFGKSVAERNYRKWCLSKRLFINPLNDLGPLPVAARDVLTLPSIIDTTRSALPPAIFGLFNQMKQEFVSARFLYYEGVHARGVHFSDRDVLLFNTLDYPAFSLATEKIRAAFRMAYSLFDKIGFFLNHHFQLGHDPNQVSFRHVWYTGKGGKKTWPLVPQFVHCSNWPLRALFWLSKDLYEPDFRSVTEPDAQALNEIRNHLEHKYLQLHIEDLGVDRYKIFAEEPDRPIYSLTAADFAAKTLRLLQLVRCALIYLSLAVQREERRRRKKQGEDKFIVPMMIHTWKDDWKQSY